MLSRIVSLSVAALCVCSMSDDTRAGFGPGGSSRPGKPPARFGDGDPAPLTPSGGPSDVPGVDAANAAVDPRAALPTPDPDLPPPTAAPAALTTQQVTTDLTAQVAAKTTINDSCVALVRGMAASFRAAAPGNAAVAALASCFTDNAEDLGHAMTDSTPFAAPAVTNEQAQRGGTKSKR